MRVRQVNVTSDDDYELGVEVSIDGKEAYSIGNLGECPEDANLVRDLNFALDVPELLRKAWEAGKAGEPFELTVEEMTREERWG
jgi:hypothetical protein